MSSEKMTAYNLFLTPHCFVPTKLLVQTGTLLENMAGEMVKISVLSPFYTGNNECFILCGIP
jgi:hypothetical protein